MLQFPYEVVAYFLSELVFQGVGGLICWTFKFFRTSLADELANDNDLRNTMVGIVFWVLVAAAIYFIFIKPAQG